MNAFHPPARFAPTAQSCRLSVRTADLLTIAHLSPEQLARTSSRDLDMWLRGLTLALRRERNKSLVRHWSYDLNRHIALKRARDRIRTEIATRADRPATKGKAADLPRPSLRKTSAC